MVEGSASIQPQAREDGLDSKALLIQVDMTC